MTCEAKKRRRSLAVEGELPEDGLAAFGDDGDDMMMVLARKIVSGDEDTETVEEVFAQTRNAEADAEELLVDDGWKAVEVNGNGHATNGNGHHANGNGHVPIRVNGNGTNGHHEAGEPQRSMFSWSEFMAEEPMKPKGRNRKPKPASTSLFEWAVEQEREAEPVGVGR